MNFKHILSKSSLQSSSYSGKGLSNIEEITKLQSEIELHKQMIESLKISIEGRDAAVGTLAREKEKLYVELKSVQRTNRNLHQQLMDERDIHSKEKDYLIEEIKRLSNKNTHESYARQNRDLEERLNYSLKEEIKAKDEVIFNICSKYLKLKFSKMIIQKKIESLQALSQKTCEDIVLLLQENRKTIDNLLSKLIKTSPLSPDSKKYLKLLKTNANLHFENTQLKVYVSSQNKLSEDNIKITSVDCCEIDMDATNITSKPEGKIKNNCNTIKNEAQRHSDEVISKFNDVLSITGYKDLKYVYKSFEPSFRNKLCRSHSDPCILNVDSIQMSIGT